MKAIIPVAISRAMTALFSLLAFVFLLGGCGSDLPQSGNEEATSLVLDIESIEDTNGNAIENWRGEESAARLAGDVPYYVSLTVRAIDANGQEVTSYEGNLAFFAQTGLIECAKRFQYPERVAHGDTIRLRLTNGIGDVVLLGEDENRFIVGVTEPVAMQMPTLSSIQKPFGEMRPSICPTAEDEPDRSPWAGAYVKVEAGERRLVVTEKTLNGFYVTDLDDTSYNHLYVFTFSTPYIFAGDEIIWVSGVIDEYFGLTEMSHVQFERNEADAPLPCPVEISLHDLQGFQYSDEDANETRLAKMTASAPLCVEAEARNRRMERYEGGLAVVHDMYLMEDFDSFGQFRVGRYVVCEDGEERARKLINIASGDTVPDFYPATEAGASKPMTIQGLLRQHYSSSPTWILTPRNRCDIWIDGERPAYCGQAQAECGLP